MLTALEIKNAKPGMHSDGAGLYLQVSKAGTKSWIFRYQIGGRRREMGLGSIDVRSAPDARAEAAILSRQVKAKIDPLEQRAAEARSEQAAKAEQAAQSITFEVVAREYVEAHKPSWKNAKHAQQWENTLATYVYPVFGIKPVGDVTTEDVLSALKPIWLSKTETARRLRSRIELVLSYAKAKQLRSGENPAMWRGHLDAILPKPDKVSTVTHQPALDYQELPGFVAELKAHEGMGARALELLILTATRSSEVRLSRWPELDLDEAIWTIPAERMKARKEHRIPLSSRAVKLLKALPRLEASDLVFFGQRNRRPLSDMTLSAVIRRMNDEELEYFDRRSGRAVVPHGFRSTFRDWAAEVTSYPREVAEMALAHAIENKVEAAYRRGDMFERRRAMMEDWADFLGKAPQTVKP